MKILVLTTKSPYPLNEGRALRTYNLIKQTAKRHEVYLLTFVQTQEEVDGIPHLREICRHVDATPLHMECGRVALAADMVLDLLGTAPLHAVKYRSATMRRKMAALMSEHKFDLVHLDMLHLGEYMALCPDTPVVLVEHNVESALLARRVANTANPLAKFYLQYQYLKLRRFEAGSCRRANHVVAVSDLDARDIRELAGISGVTVIPNGVDSSYFADLELPEVPNSLVYVGGMNWFPNLDAMRYFCAEILPRIAERIPDVSLTIIGKNPDGLAIRELKDSPRVRIAGMVDDIRPIVSAASAFIVPLRIGGGTRLKILDALSMSKALVSTSVGCEGLEAVPGKHLLVADEPAAFADAVIRVLKDRDLRRALGRSGRDFVKRKYEWDVVARELDALYENCRATFMSSAT